MKFKKPKFWDFNKPNLLSFLLLPFTLPFLISNFFLNKKSKKKFEKIKSICVGNIYVGGTGKTPSVIELFNILKKHNFRVSTGKKYYSDQLDEQSILKKKTDLICANSREKIIEIAIQNNQEVLIFDDGLQDKQISYNIKIACFKGQNWIGNGNLIPSGPLREKISSLRKFDAIFLKHAESKKSQILEIVKNINPKIEIFFTSYEVINLEKFDNSKDYLIFSGIGNPEDFRYTLMKKNFNIVNEITFPDHHNYRKIDIDQIKLKAKKLNAKIVTTEKDYIKIADDDKKNIDFVEVCLKIEDEEKLINFLKKNFYEKP
tara:strand:+ start:65 stop:1015 length:951 start_codon:yes stop_codon:yes gene_type:complete